VARGLRTTRTGGGASSDSLDESTMTRVRLFRFAGRRRVTSESDEESTGLGGRFGVGSSGTCAVTGFLFLLPAGRRLLLGRGDWWVR